MGTTALVGKHQKWPFLGRGECFAKSFYGSVCHRACSASASITPKTSALPPKPLFFWWLLLGQGGAWWELPGGRDGGEFLEETEGCTGQGSSLLDLFPADQRAARNPKRRKRRRKRRNIRKRRRRISITRRMLFRHPPILLQTGMRGSWVGMGAEPWSQGGGPGPGG